MVEARLFPWLALNALVQPPPATIQQHRPSTHASLSLPDKALALQWPPPQGQWKTPNHPNEFELNKGNVINKLQHDIPKILDHEPDFSIFHRDVELHDPSGKRLKGITQYVLLFDMIRLLRRTAIQDSEVTYRMDDLGDEIRVRWNAKLWVRDPLLGIVDLFHLDGVSVYQLDAKGQIVVHRLENVVMSGKEHISTPVNLMQLLSPEIARAHWFTPVRDALLPLQWANLDLERKKSDYASGTAKPKFPLRAPSPTASEARHSETPMERAARERGEMAAKAAEVAAGKRDLFDDKKQNGFLGALGVEKCESSFDCDKPMVCCDIFGAKFCCSGGVLANNRAPILQPQAIPIPVEKDSPQLPRDF